MIKSMEIHYLLFLLSPVYVENASYIAYFRNLLIEIAQRFLLSGFIDIQMLL